MIQTCDVNNASLVARSYREDNVTTDDMQRMEARLANLETQIAQLTQAVQAAGYRRAGGMEAGATPPAAGDMPSPGAWLAGALARSIAPPGAPGVVPGTAQAPGVGAPGALGGIPIPIPAPEHDSVWWCESRFICATMDCGGSGWC
jgi:hypothetical protein